MGFRTQKISLLPCILLLLTHLANSQPNFYCNYNRSGNNNYTSESTYRRNLNALSSYFTSGSLFYNFTIGDSNTDRVNVIALCRGDIEGDECRGCLRDANTKLTELCPNEKEAIGWYELCMLRYSDRVIFNTVNTLPNRYADADAPTPVPDASLDEFRQAVLSLLSRLTRVASGGSSVRKYATGESNSGRNSNISIFGLAQCTPDLSASQCTECLNSTALVLLGFFDWRMGGRVDTPSCNFMFVARSPTGNSTRTPQPPSDKDNNTTRNAIIIVISTIILVLFLVACIWILVRKRKQRKWNSMNDEVIREIHSVESLQYDFDTIRVATDEFSDTHKLGEGGFGVVYKGKLPNGQDIAVKRLSMGSRQGELEFKNEVLLMVNLQHRNLVRLIGFCLKREERLLIYEYLPNGSLDQFIFDSEKRACLDGDRRCKIIVAIARGILYLHEDSQVRIIHRDLKASNVLLDAKMNPKISDFGMARIFDLELDASQTHANTERIAGTYGYMAPEYVMLGHFSVKSDVYSFGVLVLEILSGQRTTGLRNGDSVEYLLSHAWKSWLDGTHSRFLDPTIKDGSFSMSDIMRCLQIGLLCVQQKAVDRPTMASIVLMLSSSSFALPTPSEPIIFSIDAHEHPGENESTQSENRSTERSNNEASITVLSGR